MLKGAAIAVSVLLGADQSLNRGQYTEPLQIARFAVTVPFLIYVDALLAAEHISEPNSEFRGITSP